MELRPNRSGAKRGRRLCLQPAFVLPIFVGGALGTCVRGGLAGLFPTTPGTFPAVIFWINVSGSFLLGLLLEGLSQGGADDGWRRQVRLAIGTGVLGGYTTYSAFSVDVVMLLRAGQPTTALGYALASLLLGPVAAVAGIAAAKSRPPRAHRSAA